MKKTQWSSQALTIRDILCCVSVVPAMTVAYRTNSIKIPKTTTICVYVYTHIDIDIHNKHTINIQ
jgi:hypothetical protein